MLGSGLPGNHAAVERAKREGPAQARIEFQGDERCAVELQSSIVTLDRILEARNIGRLTLLVVDVEGADLQVIRGFSLQKFLPDLIMIEHYHLSQKDRLALREIMRASGYRRVIGAMDTFFFKPELLSKTEVNTLTAFHSPFLEWTWNDNHVA